MHDASVVVPLRVDPAATDRDAQLLAVARALAPAWADATTASVEVVGGGITNLLFALRAEARPAVLVRIYGPSTEVVIDREEENALFASLSRAGFSPLYYGRFENGRVEGFLEGFRALEPPELGHPRFRGPIARRLREMHDLVRCEGPPRLWSTLRGWMSAATSLPFEGDAAARHEALDLPRYAAELERLERRFHQEVVPGAGTPGARAALRVVMAHNDLLAGNVLTDGSEVRFIDYEYGAPSYAAFDLANHFCEYAGFDSDFTAGFPSRAVREDVVGAYLEAPGAVSDFTDLVDFFVLPDHLWWGTWAVVQAFHSPIDFDFMDYARLRLAGFEFHRRLSPI